jgi:KDO2-lipid IV(A) lauroyltransferase
MSRDLLAGTPTLRRLAYRSLAATCRLLPLEPLRLAAAGAGALAWWFDARGRRIVARNLAHFIPAPCADARGRAVRRNYQYFAQMLVESLRLDRIPPGALGPGRLALVDPWKVFAAGPLAGAAILVTVHANWELALAAVHRLGLASEVDAIALSQGDPEIDLLFHRSRSAVGGRSLLFDRAPLAALRALKAGRVVGIIADRDYSGSGLRVPFAGEDLSMPLGPAALAVQTGAPVVPLLLARRGPSRLALVVGRPLRPDPGLAKEAQVVALTTRLAAVLARFIHAAPAQWIAFHDAWRPLPPPPPSPPAR